MRKQKVQVWVHCLDSQGVRSVLLLKLIPKRGGFWQPVTGGVEEGESLLEAVKREATEETGLSWKSEPASLDFDFAYSGRFGDVREHVFELEAKPSPTGDLPEITIDPKEHVGYQWTTPKKAMSLLKYPSNQQGLGLLAKKF